MHARTHATYRNALDGVDLYGRGHVVHHRVEQGLHALVLERGAGKHGHEHVGQGSNADALLERLHRRLFALSRSTKIVDRGGGGRFDS